MTYLPAPAPAKPAPPSRRQRPRRPRLHWSLRRAYGSSEDPFRLLGAFVRELDDVDAGRPGGNHRVAVLVGIDAGVDDGGAAAVERGLEGGLEVVGVVDHE